MGFIEHNWVNALAILGAISIFLHALELGCANAGWTKYQGIFSQLYKFIQGFLGNIPKPPAGGAAACLILMLMCGSVMADTTVAPTSSSDITTLISKIPGLKSGVIYDWQANQFIATNNLTVASYKMFDLSAGAARTNGVDVAGSVDISKIKSPILQLPVVDLLNYGNIGFGGAKMSGNKHYPHGVYASFSWKF